MKKKTILFFLYNFPNVGGVEHVTTLLANRFVSQFDVFILSLHPHLLEQPNLSPLVTVNSMPSDFTKEEQIRFYNDYILEHCIDIVINQGAYQILTPIIFNRERMVVKVVTVLHGIPMHEQKVYEERKRKLIEERKTGISRAFAFWKLKHKLSGSYCAIISEAKKNHRILAKESDAFLLLASGYIEEYKQAYGVTKLRCLKVIPNPVLPSNEGAEIAKKKEILYVGRLSNFDKRVDRLLRIWAVVSPAHPDWRLRIMGDGPDREMLEEMSRNLHLSRIEFCGYGDPVPAYRTAEIVALTSQMECLPMSLLEAEQFGCVPIAFACSAGLQEVLSFGGENIQVTPYDETEYAHKLMSLMSNIEQRSDLSRQARAWVTQYDIEIVIQKWIQLILSL